MESSQESSAGIAGIWLGLDTCGVVGSVALASWKEGQLEVLAQTELEGRSLSSTLVGAIGELLARVGVKKPDGIVVVQGPGSFTGVRVGLAAVKGLAEAWAVPVVTVSGLELLAAKAGVSAAAQDAHRQEIFLRVAGNCAETTETLVGAEELRAADNRPAQIAVCDDKAAGLLLACWPDVAQIRIEPANAADTLRFCRGRIEAGVSVDLASLDGHYLRRSDAEIFGTPTGKQQA
jgi:tRNA threonylcarbamoyladenosine biosynthesis protein TsaB